MFEDMCLAVLEWIQNAWSIIAGLPMWQVFLDKMGDHWFLYVGLPAQIAFTGRFVIQLIASERAGKSVVPLAFWYFSLIGSLGLATYFIFGRYEPLGALGTLIPSGIYVRNLMLIYRHRRNEQHHLLGEGADTAEEELAAKT